MIDLKNVGIIIRKRREQKNMTQSELAEILGYKTRDMISRIESGNVNLPMDKVVAIADALEMRVSEIISAGTEEQADKVVITKIDDPFAGLSPEDIERAKQYIELLRRSKAWQQQNGTERDGGSASRSTEK